MQEKKKSTQTFYKKGLTANFFKKSLIKNASIFKKGLIANLFKKGLIENPDKRRDKPAQRKPFQKRLDRKTPGSGVINRRNGCG